MKKYYRKAKLEDIDQVMEAVEDSRELLKEQGNGQWQFGYPNRNNFIDDINNGRSFVVFDDLNPDIIIGCCALTYEEEDYKHLYEGKWLSEQPYMVMHRVALKKSYRGKGYGKKLFEAFIEQAKIEGYRSLRIDTHEGNLPMRHLIESFDFSFCGRAILTPDKDRMMFEKLIKDEEVLQLVHPCEEYLPSYFEAIREEKIYSPNSEQIFRDSPDVIERYEKSRLGIDLLPNHVPDTHLWLVDGKDFIGQINIRHQLNDALLNFAGTIGYEIRYAKRGHGYGSLMLKLALQYCYSVLGQRKVMITCNHDNYASEKVMLNNGAVFADMHEVIEEDKPIMIKKYWINIVPQIVECDRFYLREITMDDYQSLSEIFQDPETMKFFGAPYDDKMMDLLLDWTLNNYRKYGFGFWAIIDKKTGEFIGDCGLTLQNIDNELLPEIGYHINKKYHGMHYASEAARLVKEYIFHNYTYDELYSYTFEGHEASIKVMINNGMTFKKKFSRDGENYVVYSVKR